MSPNEREREHRKILQEVLQEREQLPKAPKWPFVLLAGMIIIILITWYIPSDFFPPQAKARNIPTIDELHLQLTIPARNNTLPMESYVQNNNPALKQAATRIVTAACGEPDKRCYAEALFLFVRDNIHYAYDPVGEYYEYPQETLLTQAADCDGHAILLASLMQTVGIQTKFNHDAPNHVAVEAWLQRKQLFDPDYVYAWKYFDPTCKGCKQGEKRATP